MTDVSFDRLRDVGLRKAWEHEAHRFTPWLAENIDHIAEAVGMDLEITGTEVAVGSFAADILARRLHDDGVVLIENQLDQTDHTHLGQIMTYLAGLEAKTVIWIAAGFREPHLSAIRWLNEHTKPEFSFFALRLRVVCIGDSPYAPIFEVVEKPNGWDDELRDKVEVVQSDVSRRRAAFWTAYLQRHPSAAERGVQVMNLSNMWLPTPPAGTSVGLYAASRTSGVYVRGSRGGSFEDLLARFMPFREQLEARLGVPLVSEDEDNWLLVSKIPHSITDEASWPNTIDWMEARSTLYLAALNELFGSEA